MMATIHRIIDDARPIRAVFGGQNNFCVGFNGVTKIEPYEESGQMAPVTWLAVYKGDELIFRIFPAPDTVVYYAPDVTGMPVISENTEQK